MKPEFYRISKRVLDIVCATVGLLVLSPFGLLLGLLIKLADGGPIFYEQIRVGQFGKPFRIGDWLIVDNRHAEVVEINWRSTRLRTNDNVFLDVPNNQITKQTIVNLHYPTPLQTQQSLAD